MTQATHQDEEFVYNAHLIVGSFREGFWHFTVVTPQGERYEYPWKSSDEHDGILTVKQTIDSGELASIIANRKTQLSLFQE